MRHSTSQDPLRQTARDNAVAEACGAYLRAAIEHVERARTTCATVDASVAANQKLIDEISGFAGHAMRQIGQIHRRLLLGESIPHGEKVFSIFEPHTEWVSKGKAGVPVELGVRVCVMSDQHGFTLHHRVMERCTDDTVAVPMVRDTRERYAELRAVSMDKGFHSPRNQSELREIVETVVLPKKGRRTKAEAAREAEPEFVRLRRTHAAVESAINALEVHGLDRCRDHGIEGFQRYTGLSVLGRNVQHLGAILLRRDREVLARRRPRPKAA